MSGGHWDYDHGRWKLSAEDRREALKTIDANVVDEEVREHVYLGVKAVAALLEAAAALEKALDWYISGDDGPETLKEKVGAMWPKEFLEAKSALSELVLKVLDE